MMRADNDIIKKVLTETIQKKRPIGKPRTRWKDAIEKDINMLGRNVTVDLALDRERWRELLVATLLQTILSLNSKKRVHDGIRAGLMKLVPLQS
ncbi:Uncharacterized protein FWK35_00022628 [Aphis craccivora]|uniref:Uncharacterized protein n=1 Tax=Aphis craccivora TaxID=307492 RepID=A0A6G0YJQ4_APHCR|nr:Uncharacterized protein FWK35_00022628 [Aphis craccivora]